MRRSFLFPSLVSFLGFLAACQPAAETYDVVIRGGRVADGTGGPLVAADVGIRDGRIAAVGDLEGAVAGELIDATARVVSPGYCQVDVARASLRRRSDVSVRVTRRT